LFFIHSCFFVAIHITLIGPSSWASWGMFLDTCQQPNAFKPSIIAGTVAFGEVFLKEQLITQ
jgi:hypothetical protein